MIWFWLISGMLILAALIALLRPLLRGAGDADRAEPMLAVFRSQLDGIDSEIAQGRLTVEEAATARTEITRRMLAAADLQTEASRPGANGLSETSSRIGAAVAIAGLLPIVAIAIYAMVGVPAAIAPARAVGAVAGAAGPHDPAELEAAATQLKTKLEHEPEHLEDWVLLGRNFASLQRFADAREAYDRAIALAPNESRLHAELGEIIVVMAGGDVSPEAEAEFAKSRNDPRARFYGAEAALQRGDRAAAVIELKALLDDTPVDAPWRQAVAERLAEIASVEDSASVPNGASPQLPAGASAAGPTAQDVAAAQSMSPAARQEMIRSMVDRLAARLEANPNDREGWGRLAHAYDVLGESAKAEAARARASRLISSIIISWLGSAMAMASRPSAVSSSGTKL
jgi:cytochrome c-type biogenesis protein CcmH